MDWFAFMMCSIDEFSFTTKTILCLGIFIMSFGSGLVSLLCMFVSCIGLPIPCEGIVVSLLFDGIDLLGMFVSCIGLPIPCEGIVVPLPFDGVDLLGMFVACIGLLPSFEGLVLFLLEELNVSGGFVGGIPLTCVGFISSNAPVWEIP